MAFSPTSTTNKKDIAKMPTPPLPSTPPPSAEPGFDRSLSTMLGGIHGMQPAIRPNTPAMPTMPAPMPSPKPMNNFGASSASNINMSMPPAMLCQPVDQYSKGGKGKGPG